MTTNSVRLRFSPADEPSIRETTRSGSPWRIYDYEGEDRVPRYAVYRGSERLVWGLRTKATAARWILRLGGMMPVVELPEEAEAETAAGVSAALEMAQRSYGDDAPWWSS